MSKVAADAEMVVSYREPAYDVVKDICVDIEGFRREEEIKTLGKGLNFSDEISGLGVDYLRDRKNSQADSDQSSPGGSRKLSLADLLAEDREWDEFSRVRTEMVPGVGSSSAYGNSSVDRDVEDTSAQPGSTAVDVSQAREEESKPMPSAAVEISTPTDFPAASKSEEFLNSVSEISEVPEKREEATVAATESRGTCEIELCPDNSGPLPVQAQKAAQVPPGPSMLSDGVTFYSGHLQYTGSFSHRSESSATSARSFAFPILQSEWNGSPINMARIDRRRRRRSWHSGVLCCRF